MDVLELKQMPTETLIDECIKLDKQSKENKKLMDTYKSEIESRGLAVMDNQNVRYLKYYSKNGTFSITDKMQMEVLNIEKLKELIGEGIYKEKVDETTETEIKRKFDQKLEKALKAIFNEDYTFEMELGEFLDHMSIKPNDKQKKVLLRKLKGDYVNDKKILMSVFGFTDEKSVDFEVELWYIYKIKNAELIKAFFDEENMEYFINEIKKCILVEGKTALTLDYKKEE